MIQSRIVRASILFPLVNYPISAPPSRTKVFPSHADVQIFRGLTYCNEKVLSRSIVFITVSA